MPAAIAIPAIIASAGATVGGALISSSAVGKASQAQVGAADYAAQLQKEAADQALAEQKRQFNIGQENLAPWLESGKISLSALMGGMGLESGTPGEITTSLNPEYTSDPARATELTSKIADLQNRINQIQVTPFSQEQIQARSAQLMKVYGPQNADIPDNFFFSPSEAQAAQLKQELQGYQNELAGLAGVTPQSLANNMAPGATAATGGTTGQSPLASGEFTKPFTLADFQKDPGYEFRLSEGMKAIDRSLAARGGALSGRSVKEAQRFNQDLASGEYTNAFNRFNIEREAKYNKFASMAGVGQTTATQLANQGSQYAANVGNLTTNTATQVGDLATQAANARASGYIGSSNAWSQALGGIGSNVMDMLMLSKLMKSGPISI